MKKILLLGATGSIGRSTRNCIKRYGNDFSLIGISYHKNKEEADKCLNDFKSIKHVCNSKKEIIKTVKESDYDILVNAIVGFAGFIPTVEALKRGKTVALANKESLVVGGDLINTLIRGFKGDIVPIDSEHSAILQCIQGEALNSVESVTITASGGPFRERDVDSFDEITVEDALRHPTWEMGSKITIDSATLMNKGFEVIEAHHLYGLPYGRIGIVVHPQSIIHSYVTFSDGSVKAQMGLPDMELPIQYALTYPERKFMGATPRLDLAGIGAMTFYKPDLAKFPCLRLALEAGIAGGTYPAALNAANEFAVEKFLRGEVKFNKIAEIVEYMIDRHKAEKIESVEQICEVDKETRLFLQTIKF